MVRHYQKKGGKTQYTAEERSRALNLFLHHKSVAIASRLSGVPASTLYDWICLPDRPIGTGKKCALKKWEEDDLIDIIVYFAENGFPMRREQIKNMVQSYIVHSKQNTPKHPFGVNGKPGPDWMLQFERRHNDRIKNVKREGLAYARSKDLTKENVDKFFALYKSLDDKYHFSPSNIYNADETGFMPSSTKARVLVGTELKNAYSLQPNQGKNMFTVLFCCNAAGTYLPPFTVYKGKSLWRRWVVHGPEGAQYGVSPKGWMMDYNYQKWFSTVFCPLTKEEAGDKHRLLLMDGYNSHINYEVAKAAYDNNVHLLCLPPNTTHALQPLDVSVFRSVKALWSECCLQHYDKFPRTPIGKDKFQPMLKVIHEHCQEHPEHVVNGFRKCGFRPLNPEAVYDKILGAKERSTKRGCGKKGCTAEQDPQPRAETLSKADAQHKADLIEAIRIWVDAHLPKKLPKVLPRAKVQMQCGEILTCKESLERLKLQQKARNDKKAKTGAGVAGPSRPTVGAMDDFVVRGSRSSARQKKPKRPQDADPDDPESGHEDPPSSQGTNPEDPTVVPDGMDTTAPVDMPGSPHASAGPSVPASSPTGPSVPSSSPPGPSVPPSSPPSTPPRTKRALRKRKAVVVEESSESDSDTDWEGSDQEPEPVVEATPPRYSFSTTEELKSKLHERSSYIIFNHKGQMWPAVINKMYDSRAKVKKLKLVASETNPYTGRWEFPPKSDKWSGTAYADYTEIKHICTPPRIVGTNSRPQYIIPKVDQYWNFNMPSRL